MKRSKAEKRLAARVCNHLPCGMEKQAQDQRIETQKSRETADQQPELVAAEIRVKIAEKKSWPPSWKARARSSSFLLKAGGKINEIIIENMMNWRNSGFNVYCGKAIWPHKQEGLENLARYIIRASFSQERMMYVAAQDTSDGFAKVIYESKDGKTSKTLEALDWLAQLTTHIPNKGEQMVRYYGYYSNKSRGLRKKAGVDDQVPALIEPGMSSKEFRQNWARLIQKIYNVNPLVCSKCFGSMKIISFIEDEQLVKKILEHRDLWDVKRKPAPCANGPPPEAFIIYDESLLPSADDYIIDADYPIETYR